jgi:hypothetical protein
MEQFVDHIDLTPSHGDDETNRYPMYRAPGHDAAVLLGADPYWKYIVMLPY